MMGAPASTRKTVTARDLEVVDVLNGGDGVGGRWLMGQRQVTDLWVWRLVGLHGSTSSSFFFFFFFCGLWVVGSVIRGGHGWWSPAWEASLQASLLA